MESYKLQNNNLSSIHTIIDSNDGFLVRVAKSHNNPFDLQSAIEVGDNTMIVIDTDMILRNTDAILVLKSYDDDMNIVEYLKTRMVKPKSRYVIAVKDGCEIEMNIIFKQRRK